MGDSLVYMGYPNIHGQAEHYDGSKVLVPKSNKNRFKDIETRYLDIMKQQILASQPSEEARNNFNNLFPLTRDGDFKKFEAGIEQALAEKYNSFVEGLGFGGGTSRSILSSISRQISLPNGKKETVVEGLNKFISVIKANASAVDLLTTINNQPSNQITADLYDILGINRIIEAAGSGISQNEINELFKPLTEGLASAIDGMVNGLADEALIKSMKQGMVGAKGSVTPFLEGRSVASKAADIKMRRQNVSFSSTIRQGDKEVITQHTLEIQPYGSVKAYRSRSNLGKLIQYGGQNAIVMSILRQIYGSGDATDYAIYNTLAFHKNDGSSLGQNFKVIRSDIIAEYAEKYIIGFAAEEAQALYIIDFVAYPTLSIISAIIDQAVQREAMGKSAVDKGAIFNISFEDLYKVKNTWVGDANTLDLDNKITRIKQTKQQIESATTRGILNTRLLKKYVSSNQLNGIPLNLSSIKT